MWHVEGAADGEVKRSAVAPRANLPTPSVSDSAVRGIGNSASVQAGSSIQMSQVSRKAGMCGYTSHTPSRDS